MGHQQPRAIKGRLSADVKIAKVFVLSVPTVGNDPSGQCMCVWEYMQVVVSGTNDDGWRCSHHCRRSKYSMVHIYKPTQKAHA